MQYLIMMLGYIGSGKSHFAKQLANDLHAVRLNADTARHNMFVSEEQRRNPKNHPMVFGALNYACEEVLKAGYSVIYDVGHNKKADRNGGIELSRKYGATPIIVWIQVPIETARTRAGTREVLPDQPRLIGERFDRMVANFHPPTDDEKYISIDGTVPYESQLASFYEQLKAFS